MCTTVQLTVVSPTGALGVYVPILAVAELPYDRDRVQIHHRYMEVKTALVIMTNKQHAIHNTVL